MITQPSHELISSPKNKQQAKASQSSKPSSLNPDNNHPSKDLNSLTDSIDPKLAMTLSPILPFNKLPGLKRDSTDENSLKDLKKASFTLLPDHPNAHSNLVHDTFDDILISRQKQYKDGKTDDLNREKMVQEAR